MTQNGRPSPPPMQQLSFLDLAGDEALGVVSSEPPPVDAHSTLQVGRVWFRQHLVDQDRPQNTVESYIYDLVVLEHRITNKLLSRINETDIAMYLADASSKVTRKRRLTSVKAFFRFLVDELKILKVDPTESFSPHPLELKKPDILTKDEQAAMMTAALGDEPWSASAIWLMMHLGIGRSELLALKRDHIDRTTWPGPEVVIAYDTPGKRSKQRTLHATVEFGEIYGMFLEQKQPEGVLFPYGPQAVNGMVERVANLAGIERRITPQLLRHTAAVQMAGSTRTVNEMLALLGLANDARNRETVRMYLEMARDMDPLPEENEEA